MSQAEPMRQEQAKGAEMTEALDKLQALQLPQAKSEVARTLIYAGDSSFLAKLHLVHRPEVASDLEAELTRMQSEYSVLASVDISPPSWNQS